jgi:hypothetical protein
MPALDRHDDVFLLDIGDTENRFHRRYGGHDALAAAIVDRTADEHGVRQAAAEIAQPQAAKAGLTLGTTKTRMYAPVLDAPAVVPRRSCGSRLVSDTSSWPGIGSWPAASSQPNQLPRRCRTPKSTRIAGEPPWAGSSEAMTSSSIGKSPAPPYTGRAQTSSSVKSGAISRMRQGRVSCTAFGSLMLIPDPYDTVWMMLGTVACVCQYGAV